MFAVQQQYFTTYRQFPQPCFQTPFPNPLVHCSYEAVEDVLQVPDLYDPRTQWASYIVNAIKVRAAQPQPQLQTQTCIAAVLPYTQHQYWLLNVAASLADANSNYLKQCQFPLLTSCIDDCNSHRPRSCLCATSTTS